MQKQKKGFWLFIFSLIPGAGEMYMGFRKQGISIMLLFYGLFAIGVSTGMDWIIMFFPIVWFYSFFNVHNLKSLSEEEFYSIEDSYILHMDEFLGNTNIILTKYRLAVAILMITFGVSILWNSISDVLYGVLPERLANLMQNTGYMLPQMVLAACIILGGIYLLKNKKAKLEAPEDDMEDEHFWQPYRPYAQNEETLHAETVAAKASSTPTAPSHTAAAKKTVHLQKSSAPAEAMPTAEAVPVAETAKSVETANTAENTVKPEVVNDSENHTTTETP